MASSNKRRPFLLQKSISAILILIFLPCICLSNNYPDLTDLTVEELMNIEVTSVSKKPQKISEAAAAVFVITAEDIRRSGVTSISEALRMVPGLQVARIDGNNRAISSRGFNGIYANKLLVLIDGRSVYTPLYSGVFWATIQDTLLPNIDRIEVIRGPGAALWGANAVNGIINIISKHAEKTQGNLVTLGAGTEENGFGSVRLGRKLNTHTFLRAYTKYINRDESVFVSGDKADDDAKILKSGFRIDRKVSSNNSLMLMGEIYDVKLGETITWPTPIIKTRKQNRKYTGSNILARWGHNISDTSNMEMKIYYDRTKNDSPIHVEVRDTFDIDFQNSFTVNHNHEMLWGLGYRFTRDNITNTSPFIFTPDRRHDDLASGFLQDSICFLNDKLILTLGSKFEYNDYTGFEIQPNARLVLISDKSYSLWTAISRSVRTPSRSEHDLQLTSVAPDAPGGVSTLISSNNYESEVLLAYELGYRVRPFDNISIDIAGYYNDYDDLRTFEIINIFPFQQVVDNKMVGHVYGLECSSEWHVTEWLHLKVAYSYLQMQLHQDKNSSDPTAEEAEGESPHHQLSFRSSLDVFKDIEMDLWLRYVDSLPAQDVSSYVTLDMHLSWDLNKKIKLSVIGKNLLDNRRSEFVSEIISIVPTEIQQSVYGKITFNF